MPDGVVADLQRFGVLGWTGEWNGEHGQAGARLRDADKSFVKTQGPGIHDIMITWPGRDGLQDLNDHLPNRNNPLVSSIRLSQKGSDEPIVAEIDSWDPDERGCYHFTVTSGHGPHVTR